MARGLKEQLEYFNRVVVPTAIKQRYPGTEYYIDYSDGVVRHMDEKDPNGLELKQAGAKADDGKPAVTRGCLHYFPRALTEVARLSTIGAKKYSWKGWESVSDGINRYGDALGRHELRIESDFSRRDPDTGVLEATAVAWNALARLELILRDNELSDKAKKMGPYGKYGDPIP